MVASLRRSCVLLIAGAALTVGCASEPLSPAAGRVDDYIAGVTARNGQVTAVLRDSAPPPASFGPAAQVTATDPVVHAGSASFNIAGGADFTRVYVSTPMGAGCWDVTLPNGVTVEDLVMGLSPKLRNGRLKVRFTLEGPSGVGGAAEQEIDVGQ
ncbi:MAG TPA: hypothetical protein VK688_10595 [Gemmatimonadales bacterium]|nr:hypothetical protein [Gemmatimonadales bacterium]